MRAGLLRTVYRATKAADPTRPVIDTSGYTHLETDVDDSHDYEGKAEAAGLNLVARTRVEFDGFEESGAGAALPVAGLALVCPSNCISRSFTETTAVNPSSTSSPVNPPSDSFIISFFLQ